MVLGLFASFFGRGGGGFDFLFFFFSIFGVLDHFSQNWLVHHVVVRLGNVTSFRDGVFIFVICTHCASNLLRFTDLLCPDDSALNVKNSIFSFQFQTESLTQGRHHLELFGLDGVVTSLDITEALLIFSFLLAIFMISSLPGSWPRLK